METTPQVDAGRREGSQANRGFASMNDERQREIARKGGRAAHAKGTAHEFTPDEARAAGQKGGQRVSANREHMSRIGRIGGKKSAGKRQEMRQSKANSQPGESSSNESRPGQNAPGGESSEASTSHHGQSEAHHQGSQM